MKIYKFKDITDGNYCFVLAASESEARAKVENLTSLEFELVEARSINEVAPIVVYNTMLPF